MLFNVNFHLCTKITIIYGTHDKSERPPLVAMVVTEVLNLVSSDASLLTVVPARDAIRAFLSKW